MRTVNTKRKREEQQPDPELVAQERRAKLRVVDRPDYDVGPAMLKRDRAVVKSRRKAARGREQ